MTEKQKNKKTMRKKKRGVSCCSHAVLVVALYSSVYLSLVNIFMNKSSSARYRCVVCGRFTLHSTFVQEWKTRRLHDCIYKMERVCFTFYI